MGLQLALKAHAKKDLVVAASHYQQALDQKEYKSILFQNYGALLRELGKVESSQKVYKLGLKLYPQNFEILRNYANLLKDIDPLSALEKYFQLLHRRILDHRKELNENDFLSIIEVLHALDKHSWAYEICFYAIAEIGLSPGLSVQCLKIFSYFQDLPNVKSTRPLLQALFTANISGLSAAKQSEYFYSLSWMHFQDNDLPLALDFLFKARKIVENASELSKDEISKSITVNDLTSWNAATILLNNQNFKLGWQLFEHGLRVAAKGPQGWQRAMPKPFTNVQLTLWRGESLSTKSLLLLEEQAVGDVMQFLTLLPTLLSEARHVGLLLNKRLVPVYERSLKAEIESGNVSIWSFADVRLSKLLPNMFDFQSPIGSICQYRFLHPKLYSPRSPMLITNNSLSSLLRNKYLQSSSHSSSKKKVIGISWRGGGNSSRIKQKSIDVKLFSTLIQGFEDIQFVSLQYGDVVSDISYFAKQGIEVIHDLEFNPIKSLDKWLIQVASCDAVISVANTTIHGAGGLAVPTMCLLSESNDWRWLADLAVDQSYWYPSVGIVRENSEQGWDGAFSKVRLWLDAGCPISWSCSYTVY